MDDVMPATDQLLDDVRLRGVGHDVAVERVVSFAQLFGEAHLTLACHAAFPLVLTPDLLYRLWANFVPQAPWTAVADVILSPLCREVGYELYEMDVTVRNLLLKELKEDERFGQQRLSELADFLTDYVAQQLQSDDLDVRKLAQAQQWTSLAYTRPSEAVHKLAKALSELVSEYDREHKQEDGAELIRLASLTETFVEPLGEFEPLLVVYARAMANFARGNEEAAAQLVEKLVLTRQVQAAGIRLSIPEHIVMERRVDYRNPFIVAGPVPPERFIGRGREVNAILDRLANPAHGSTAVSGGGGIGKSSLLHYISSPEVVKKWGLSPEKCTFIFVDSHAIAPFSSMEFWRYVLKSLAARKVYEPKYIEGLLQRNDVGGFELGELFDRIARDGKLVVLLLSEFEYIVEHINPDDPGFLYLLRALLNRPARGLALVLASRKPLQVLCQNIRFVGSPFPPSFASLSLVPFSPEEASQLIDVYTQGTGVTFSDRDREFAYEVSKGHPYWLQRTCFKLFQRHVEKMVQRRSENEWEVEIAEETAEEMEFTKVATEEPESIGDSDYREIVQEIAAKVKRPVVLHLSDLQFGPYHAFEDDQRTLDKLKEDIDRYEREGIPLPNIVVISGDLADTGGDRDDEYRAVSGFLEGLCQYLGISKRHVVLVPGNHDVNWHEAAYIEEELKLELLKSRRREPFDSHSDVHYLQRFSKYAEFYNHFYRKDDGTLYYSCDLSSKEGFNTIYNFHSEWGIAFLALNSGEKEDHHTENRYGYISPSVLKSALEEVEAMIPATCVKVAVFHHNALAEEREDRLRNFRSDILPVLSQAGFSLILHGHTHKPDVDDLGPELTEGARVRVVGAGSVSVARAQRPGSDKEGQVPNQYWVLAFELGDERKQFTAYARQYDPNLAGKHTRGKWIPYPIFTVAGKVSDRRTFEIGTI